MNKETLVTVLVVDDDSVDRKSIADYLNQENYRVVFAADSQEGLDCFHSSCPDLVLFNIDMPDKRGIDSLKSILEQAPGQPIILLTSDENSAGIINAVRLGINDYQVRPIANMELLGLSISNSLSRARLVAENNSYRKKLELINLELEARVEIFKHDQQAGRHVQMSMLPPSPQDINGCQFAHFIIPSLFLSGDSVDYKPVTKHSVIFYIADVSGHGSSSAFITVLLRFRIEQMRRGHILDRFHGEFTPASILGALNKDLLDAGLDKHITLFIGILDGAARELTFSVAGHYPLPVLFTEGRSSFIEIGKPSFPIGLSEDAGYTDEKLALTAPFSLTMFSDGILETMELMNVEDKENHLLEIISGASGDYEKIKQSLNLDSLENVPDDIAMISVTGK